ncbi:MAG: putative hemin transport system permease protein HmuU [Pseudomonadota bacterium]|jgi:iron complex transport system permease protein
MTVAASPLPAPLANGIRARLRPASLLLPGLALALPLAVVAALGLGAMPVAAERVLLALAAGLGLADGSALPAHEVAVVLDIRLPRIITALAVGAALAVSGALLQALFRNPLADPGLIGVSSGAALAAVATIVLGGPLTVWAGYWALPVAAFTGGLATTLLIWRLARVEGQVDVATLLLAGIAVNAIAGAGIGVMSFLSDDQQLRSLTFWTLGSLAAAGWEPLAPALPLLLLPLLPVLARARDLDLLSLGEEQARHLGVEVGRLKTMAVLCVALTVGAAVATVGPIGFIGLVVPHLIRLAVGPGHRVLLPAAALGGALMVLLADTAARTIAAPAELPIGLLTAGVGGPFFLALLLHRKGRLGT